jgi:hypothetical protein
MQARDSWHDNTLTAKSLCCTISVFTSQHPFWTRGDFLTSFTSAAYAVLERIGHSIAVRGRSKSERDRLSAKQTRSSVATCGRVPRFTQR